MEDKNTLLKIFNKLYNRYAFNMKVFYDIEISCSQEHKSIDVTIWNRKIKGYNDLVDSYTIYIDVRRYNCENLEDELKLLIKQLDEYKK